MNVYEVIGREVMESVQLREAQQAAVAGYRQLLGVLHEVCVGTLDPCRVEVNLQEGTCKVLPAEAPSVARAVELPEALRHRVNGQLPTEKR